MRENIEIGFDVKVEIEVEVVVAGSPKSEGRVTGEVEE
jgi:hypothetical protein